MKSSTVKEVFIMAKPDAKWVLLCSVAISTVYSAGYVSTASQTNQVDTTGSQYAQHQNQVYKDGKFSGFGSNRRGSIQVSVTTQNDEIVDVEISYWAMHYSERDVIDLPDKVVEKQTAQIKNVSGATYSTEAFKEAISDALSQSQSAIG